VPTWHKPSLSFVANKQAKNRREYIRRFFLAKQMLKKVNYKYLAIQGTKFLSTFATDLKKKKKYGNQR